MATQCETPRARERDSASYHCRTRVVKARFGDMPLRNSGFIDECVASLSVHFWGRYREDGAEKCGGITHIDDVSPGGVIVTARGVFLQ